MKRQKKVNEQVRALVDRDGHLVIDRKLVIDILNDQYKSAFVDEPEDIGLPKLISKMTKCFDIEGFIDF